MLSPRSFDGNDVHGTMLPSTAPLQQDSSSAEAPPSSSANGRVRRSNGYHQTTPLVDLQAAKSYQRIRTNLQRRNSYWKGNVA